MFSEILKIIPKLDGPAMARLQATMSSRFTKIAKKFGSGLKSALLGGGALATIGMLIQKILNPLKETQEAIDKLLNEADDISDMAKEFNTTEGKLFNLRTLAGAKGIDPEQLSMLMNKFQVAVAEALNDPTKQTAVRNFAVEGADNADQFFKFIQAVGKLDTEKRLLVQNEVFGEKQNVKISDFMNTDFVRFMKTFPMANADEMTGKIKAGNNLAELERLAEAKRKQDDFREKLGAVDAENIFAKDANERVKSQIETGKFTDQEKMARVDAQMAQIMAQLDKWLLLGTSQLKRLDDVTDIMKKIPVAKFMRGVLSPFGQSEK